MTSYLRVTIPRPANKWGQTLISAAKELINAQTKELQHIDGRIYMLGTGPLNAEWKKELKVLYQLPEGETLTFITMTYAGRDGYEVIIRQ